MTDAQRRAGAQLSGALLLSAVSQVEARHRAQAHPVRPPSGSRPDEPVGEPAQRSATAAYARR